MISIRKFVGYTGAAAALAALALALSTNTGLASAPKDHEAVAQLTPSAACSSAIQTVKDAFAADSSEDASERAIAKTNPDLTADQNEDATEVTNFRSLFASARTACAPAVTSTSTSNGAEATEKTLTPSAQCTAALQALKAAWAQGRPTTTAQWQQLQTLAQAVRTACGWSWSGGR
jgi:hypothetical protein